MHHFRQLSAMLLAGIVLLGGCVELPVQIPSVGSSLQPTAAEVDQALRQALGQGITRAVGQLGREGGFSRDPQVRIPLPAELQRAGDALTRLGQERYVREFEQTLNRAAEESVPYATAIFTQAIRNMTLNDVMTIMRGPDDAATQYFRRQTEADLRAAFLPVVSRQTERVGVTRSYKSMVERAGPFASLFGMEVQDLDSYVTQQALDGLFQYIAGEERRIREEPVARTTELLRKVFGYYAD